MVDLQIFNTIVIKSKVIDEYKVHFINNLKDSLEEQLMRSSTIFVIDENVYNLFKTTFLTFVDKQKIILISSSEKNKTIGYAPFLIRELIANDIRKSDTIIAIGGGITQDIVAFVSSILFRGVKWIFYPTTLLAQCDSCIGSKSSINFDKYKNLLGTFIPPNEIFIYPHFLSTLTDSEIKSGIGEMLHYFFTDGIDQALSISKNYHSLFIDRNNLLPYIYQSLLIKKNTIEIDEFDLDIRHKFNYGHTFGHAIEAICDYTIPHGQAVTIGMDIANFISLKLNLLSIVDFDQMHNIILQNKPQFSINQDNIENFVIALSKDKKNKGNQLGCILSKGPGEVEKHYLTMDDEFKKYILEYFQLY